VGYSFLILLLFFKKPWTTLDHGHIIEKKPWPTPWTILDHHGTKVKIRAKFIPWLLHQVERRDPVGDLAKDVMQDMADYDAGTELDGDRPDLGWSWKNLYRHIHAFAAFDVKLAIIEAAKLWRSNPFLEFRDPPTCAGVYCVSYGSLPQLVKIGRANNIAKRLRGLGTGAPGGVVLRAVLSLDPDDEKVFHEKFARHHFDGEWFRADLLKEVE